MTDVDNVGSPLTNTITASRCPLETTDKKCRSTNTVGSPLTTAASVIHSNNTDAGIHFASTSTSIKTQNINGNYTVVRAIFIQ